MGDGVVLAIHAVGLRTVVGESLGIGGAVVVLGIAGIDVALSAEARFEIDDLVGVTCHDSIPLRSRLRTPSRPATVRLGLTVCPRLMSVSSESVLFALPYARKLKASVSGPLRLKLARRVAPSLELSGMLVNTVMEPRKRSVGRLVMMLTTPPAAPEP